MYAISLTLLDYHYYYAHAHTYTHIHIKRAALITTSPLSQGKGAHGKAC